MTDYFIVVDDPTREFWSGSLVDSNRNRMLEARGVVTLPILPQLAKLSGVGGYAKREWGAGFPLDFLIPKMCCPLTMFCTRDYHHITWVARLLLEPPTAGKPPPSTSDSRPTRSRTRCVNSARRTTRVGGSSRVARASKSRKTVTTDSRCMVQRPVFA